MQIFSAIKCIEVSEVTLTTHIARGSSLHYYGFDLSTFPEFLKFSISHERCTGPLKLIKRVKIAHSFLQSVPDQFHVIILSLAM